MPYCTVSDVKRYLGITSDDDNDLIADFITRAEAAIDSHTGRTFEATTDATRYFDAVGDVDATMLYVDDLCSITSVVNGDGTTVTSGQYVTEPRRIDITTGPYYALRLLGSSGVSWTYTTDPENAIAVTGRWAWYTSVPPQVTQACERWAGWMYRQRENRTGDEDRAIIAGNATILPAQIPSDITDLLKSFRRVVD